jgi:sulfhydrogenase subunit gamma (sulfur reductase)
MISSSASSTSPYMPERAILRNITPLTQDNHLFEFSLSEKSELKKCRPGQFVQLWLPGVGECPISVCSADINDRLELCVRRVGRVTNALFQLQEGAWVGIRGPFGNGFPVEKLAGRNVCMIAGGLGVAPIRSVWQWLLQRRELVGEITLIYGMRHSIDLLFRQEIKLLMRRPDLSVFVAAEEIVGPDLPPIATQLGRVTDMIRLASLDDTYEFLVCGPPIMYKFVISELKKKGIADERIWLSLERHMKCGVGKCGHCFIGGKFCCKQGPVFNLSEMRFMQEVVECANG